MCDVRGVAQIELEELSEELLVEPSVLGEDVVVVESRDEEDVLNALLDEILEPVEVLSRRRLALDRRTRFSPQLQPQSQGLTLLEARLHRCHERTDLSRVADGAPQVEIFGGCLGKWVGAEPDAETTAVVVAHE